jgi:hypothetical protein
LHRAPQIRKLDLSEDKDRRKMEGRNESMNDCGGQKICRGTTKKSVVPRVFSAEERSSVEPAISHILSFHWSTHLAAHLKDMDIIYPKIPGT